MTLKELINILTSKNIYPIRVDAVNGRKGESNLSFIGTLDEYIKAIEVLGAKAVFVSTIAVTDDHFVYTTSQNSTSQHKWPFPTPGIASSEEVIEDEIQYDLCSVSDELKKYKTRIGEDGYFELLACNLTYAIYEQWMQELEIARAEAVEIIDAQMEAEEDELLAKEEEQQAEVMQRLEDAVKQLRALISDKHFAGLSTQRAMKAYAIDKIPELEELDDARLKVEIQNIAAKIEARKSVKS